MENKPTKFSCIAYDVMPSNLPVAIAMINSMALDPRLHATKASVKLTGAS